MSRNEHLHVIADRLVELGHPATAFYVRSCADDLSGLPAKYDAGGLLIDAKLIPTLRWTVGNMGPVDATLLELLERANEEHPELRFGMRIAAARLLQRGDPPARAKLEDKVLHLLSNLIYPSSAELWGRAGTDGHQAPWRRELLLTLGWGKPAVGDDGKLKKTYRPPEYFLERWKRRHGTDYRWL